MKVYSTTAARIAVILGLFLLSGCKTVFVQGVSKPIIQAVSQEGKARNELVTVHAPQLEDCVWDRYKPVYKKNMMQLAKIVSLAIKEDSRFHQVTVDEVILDYSFDGYFMNSAVDCPDRAYWYNALSIGLIPGWAKTKINMTIRSGSHQATVTATKLNIYHLFLTNPPPVSLLIGYYADWPEPVRYPFDDVHTDLLVDMLLSGIEELYQKQVGQTTKP